MVKDLLNSPVLFAVLIALIPFGLIFLKIFSRRKCPVCKKGKLKKVHHEPEKVTYHSTHRMFSGGGHSTTQVHGKLKLQCDRCGATWNTTQTKY